jgi:hypothetical protein
MRTLALLFGIFGMLFAFVDTSQAQPFAITYVSKSGTDTTCDSHITACHTFQKAINNTLPDGVVRVIAPGEYGSADITKALSIVADGVEGGIVGAAVGSNPFPAIFVHAGPNDVVYLRGLMIDQLEDNLKHGIYFTSGKALHVQNMLIRRAAIAILFQPTGISQLYISDSTSADSAHGGIVIGPQGANGNARVVIDRTRMLNRSEGLTVNGPALVTVRDSTASGNGTGISAHGPSSSKAVNVLLDRTALLHNFNGALADGPFATIRIGDSTITGNGTGLVKNAGGLIYSYKTNKLTPNTTSGTFSTPAIPYF